MIKVLAGRKDPGTSTSTKDTQESTWLLLNWIYNNKEINII